METFFSLITHLSLLILLLFQVAPRSDTLSGNGVADQRRYPRDDRVEGSVNMAISPESYPTSAPAPSSGGTVSTSPDYSWPFHFKQVSSPSWPPAPADAGEGMPFINSNPTIPLPAGEADSVTIRPLPISGHQDRMEAGLAFQIPVGVLVCVILLKG